MSMALNCRMDFRKRTPERANGLITFVVRFKFARLSHQANKMASIIPMLLIAGYPVFFQKLYAVKKENGYWQGMYEWESLEHLEAYKQSFVYRMMNKRSLNGTLNSQTFPDCQLSDMISPDQLKKTYDHEF